MNIAYRLVWNLSRCALVPVPEFARRACKAAGPRILGAAVLAGFPCATLALPSGAQAVSGTAAVSQAGNSLTVTNSANAIVNWQKFAIGAGETVKFQQPSASSAVLNRVVGSDPSAIYGLLQSNGRVWLINPAGILVGPTGRIDTAGFVASTLGIRNEDFLAGRLLFQKSVAAPGSVVNQGTIATPSGGQIYLVAPELKNQGSLAAPNGEVLLAAGQSVQLIDTGTPGVRVEVKGDGTATNLGRILAQAGRIGIAGMLVKNAGTLDASNVVSEGGRIFLRASKGVKLTDSSVIEADGVTGGSVSIQVEDRSGQIAGTLKARGVISAQGDGSAGSGGFVETSAAKPYFNGLRVQTNGGTWLIDAGDFTISKHGNISGSSLASQLNGNHVTILTSGAAWNAGDIDVKDAVAWNSANSLTLSALHSVNVNQPISNAGSGNVTLRADNAGACVAGAINCGTVTFAGAGHLTLNGGAANIYYNPAGSNAPADANGNGPSYATPTDYAGDATLDGGSTLTSWMLVNDVNQLQAISTNSAGHYALGRDIDASATVGWNGGAGFLPIGMGMSFTGTFDGLGHVIDRLAINRPMTDRVGLFGVNAGALANIGLTSATIVGDAFVGGLAGDNAGGSIANSYSGGVVTGKQDVGGLVGINSGSVTGSYATGNVYGLHGAGGLIGENDGSTSNAYATGSVNSQEDGAFSGGLVGYNTGSITNAYATGSVMAWGAGGLVGQNFGTIQSAHATGHILFSRKLAGGLVADNRGTVRDSYASGDVQSFVNYLGGLVGVNSGLLSHVFATGEVVGDSAGPGAFTPPSIGAGGLVGYNIGTIDHAYATGLVHGAITSGGLVGRNAGAISDSFATGEVAFSGRAGGLVGENEGSIRTSYSTGVVSGATQRGGLVANNTGTVSGSYWDITTSGQTTSAGGTGLTDGQMRQQNSFVGFDFDNIWIMKGQGYPLLRAR